MGSEGAKVRRVNAFSAGCEYFAWVSGTHGQINIYNDATGETACLMATYANVRALAWAPRTPLLAIGYVSDIELWRFEAGAWSCAEKLPLLHEESEGFTGRIGALAWSPDGASLLASLIGGSVRRWIVGNHTWARRVWRGKGTLYGRHTPVCWSPDGTRMAWTTDTMLCISDPFDENAEPSRDTTWARGNEPAVALDWSLDGNHLVAVVGTGRIKCFGAATGFIAEYILTGARNAQYSANSQYLLCNCGNGSVRVLRVSDGQCAKMSTGGVVDAAAWMPPTLAPNKFVVAFRCSNGARTVGRFDATGLDFGEREKEAAPHNRKRPAAAIAAETAAAPPTLATSRPAPIVMPPTARPTAALASLAAPPPTSKPRTVPTAVAPPPASKPRTVPTAVAPPPHPVAAPRSVVTPRTTTVVVAAPPAEVPPPPVTAAPPAVAAPPTEVPPPPVVAAPPAEVLPPPAVAAPLAEVPPPMVVEAAVPAVVPPTPAMHLRFVVLCALMRRHYTNAQAPGFAADAVRFQAWTDTLMKRPAPAPDTDAECEFAAAATELIFEARRALAAGRARSSNDPVRAAVVVFQRDFDAFRALFVTLFPRLDAAMIPSEL